MKKDDIIGGIALAGLAVLAVAGARESERQKVNNQNLYKSGGCFGSQDFTFENLGGREIAGRVTDDWGHVELQIKSGSFFESDQMITKRAKWSFNFQHSKNGIQKIEFKGVVPMNGTARMEAQALINGTWYKGYVIAKA